MARPKQYGDRVQTNVRLPRELHTKLQAEAHRRMVSVNLVVEEACAAFVAVLEPRDRFFHPGEDFDVAGPRAATGPDRLPGG